MVLKTTTGDPLGEALELAKRQIEGIYTLDEAADAVCQNIDGLNRAQMLADLKSLVEKGEVKMDRPGTLDITPAPVNARTFYEVVQWDDLNKNWLSKYQFIDWQFPDPLERLRPDWSYWNCDHLSLKDAVSLSVNITPDWIDNKGIGRRNTLRISFDYSPRLTNALNWAQNPDCIWRYDNVDEFEVSNQIKLGEFARWLIQEKPDWVIPSEFKALAKASLKIDKPAAPRILRPEEWHLIAERYAAELLAANDKLSLEMVADKIRDRFAQDEIGFVKGDMKASTIKTHLSKDWGFNRQRTKIKNNKK